MNNVIKQFEIIYPYDDTRIIEDVREFAQWHVGGHTDRFDPTRATEVDLKTYLLHLRISGHSPEELQAKSESLRRFYEWIHGEGLITAEEFAGFQFDSSLAHAGEVRMRKQSNDQSRQEIELQRLRTLNHISEILNRSADLRNALSTTLAGLVEVLGLKTGWVSLRKETAKFLGVDVEQQPHDFCLSASCNLPPELERDNLKYLRRPPDCYCQKLLREGRLTHAVNVVECTRIHEAAKAIGAPARFNYHASVPLATSDKVHGVLNIATEDWELFSGSDLKLLSIVGQQIASAVERGKLYEVTRMQQARMQRELSIAHSVQASFIPKKLPEVPGFDLAAEWRSAREVAGDFYDIFALDDKRWGFVVADVSGKGVPAALYMATVRTLIRECKECASPGEMLAKVNGKLLAYSSSDMFVTVFCGLLEPNTGKLVYANAGHDSPILRRASGEMEELQSTGPLLGVFGREPFACTTVTLDPGDTILIYTDGITDARDAEDREYGIERLQKCIASVDITENARTQLEGIFNDVQAFVDSERQIDDITLFLIRKT